MPDPTEFGQWQFRNERHWIRVAGCQFVVMSCRLCSVLSIVAPIRVFASVLIRLTQDGKPVGIAEYWNIRDFPIRLDRPAWPRFRARKQPAPARNGSLVVGWFAVGRSDPFQLDGFQALGLKLQFLFDATGRPT